MLATARDHYAVSRLIAQRAAREAVRARPRGLVPVASVVIAHQAAQAQRSEAAVGAMLAEQGYSAPAPAALNHLAFTTSTSALAAMLDSAGDAGFAQLVASLVQAAGRSAESVSAATRNVPHVRHLRTPSCSRCAVLAGRVYRFSEGFLRHPNCDCVMVPVTSAGTNLTIDPAELAERGMVTGLSKADLEAVRDGADFGQVVNVRRASAGLQESGRALSRAGRPTPEAIYRAASGNHAEAMTLLRRHGYIT